MLVIANGAEKCGSTWLASIVLNLVDHKPLPDRYHDTRFGAIPSIKRGLLRKFLDEADYANDTYVTKNHYYYERGLLSRYQNVYVVDIQRNIADALVSLFFHTKKRMEEWGVQAPDLDDIRNGYWRYGPDVVRQITRYHAVWARRCSWVYVSSYERLKEDPRKEIGAIASFLALEPSPEKIEAVVAETSFDRLSAKLRNVSGYEARFRKGVVGDHKNYFDDAILEDIRRIEAENIGYPRTLVEKLEFAWHCSRKAGRPYELRAAERGLLTT